MKRVKDIRSCGRRTEIAPHLLWRKGQFQPYTDMGQTISQRQLLLLLTGFVLLLAACSQPTTTFTETITLEELPVGIGRGFPVASLSEIEGNRVIATQGEVAPNFRMVLDDGTYLSLADLQGRPVMINFWATWCGPCRVEMPDIVELANQDEELVVLAVNVQEELAQLEPFTKEFGMTMPVVRDSDAALRQLYDVRGMPTSVFIDREGQIDTIWRGFLTEDALEGFVAEIR